MKVTCLTNGSVNFIDENKAPNDDQQNER